MTPVRGQYVAEIADLLIARSQTVCVMESSAGGLVSAALAARSGASSYFVGGTVLYSYPIRAGLVGMGRQAHTPYGGSTPELILDLSRALQRRVPEATWVIGEGGAAGPTPSPYGHPAGYTALAIHGPINRTSVLETGYCDRAYNMNVFADSLLCLFRDTLLEHQAVSDN